MSSTYGYHGFTIDLPTLRSTDLEAPATPIPALKPHTSTATIDAARYRQGVDGFGEPMHLGGGLDYDTAASSISKPVFELVLQRWGVRSLVDLGCGRGWAASWFHLQGVKTQCVEGSDSALQGNLLPATQLVNHDFTRGPWWPNDTVDLVWSTNFVQQVSRQYMQNYMVAMSRSAILLVSFSQHPGWHTVEVHDIEWWTLQFESHGFVLNQRLTSELQHAARLDWNDPVVSLDGYHRKPMDLIRSTRVFLNPRVRASSVHTHLFPEHGCYKGHLSNGTMVHRECNIGAGVGLETPLDPAFAPPVINQTQSRLWDLRILAKMHDERQGTSLDNGTIDVQPSSPVPRRHSSLRNMSHHVVRQIPEQVARGNRTLPKVPVVVWPLWEFGPTTAESLHMERNGIEESPFLEPSDNIFNFDPNVVWVGDVGYAYGWDVWCHKFLEHIERAQARRAHLGLPTSWPIYLIDWTDFDAIQRCDDVEQAVGRDFVQYSKRSLVEDRHWNNDKEWVELGKRFNQTIPHGPVYHHIPLVVRTDTIQNLQTALQSRGMNLFDRLETLDRPVDVTHLWPTNPSDEGSGVGDVKSKLRTLVSKTVLELGNQTGLKVYVGLAGDAVGKGRRGVSSAYIEALLSTKIVMVTQRDRWEDHYRLFEALTSGAMVMTDRMLSLPAGLQNGTSIVEFGSAIEMRSLLQYYIQNRDERLKIAREGRHVAMMRHRTWHRMEEIIFGRALTRCLESNNTLSPCPYHVHANETYI